MAEKFFDSAAATEKSAVASALNVRNSTEIQFFTW